ncbi:MAG: hypothetical protein IJK39_06620 [Bacteroidales bacterium]|nr:hypothetical protein [Bacteroidales bacterium]
MKILRLLCASAMTVLLTGSICQAQNIGGQHIDSLPKVKENGVIREYWGNTDKYLFQQNGNLLILAEKVLEQEGPSAKPSDARQLALTAIDVAAHDTARLITTFLQVYVNGRLSDALKHLTETQVHHPDQSPHQHAKPEAVEVVKLYNDGFIVRSESVTLGFDLCFTAGEQKMLQDKYIEKMVSLCDALFISHRDSDHCDRRVIEIAKKLGVPVYGPQDTGIEYVKGYRSDDFSEVELTLKSGKKIEAIAIPGHQDELQNNIWMVTLPEKRTVVHFGDQWKKEDVQWLKEIKQKVSKTVDVLIIDCWAMHLEAMIKAFAPAYVIPGHENELGHTIDHREAYWLTQYKIDKMSIGIPSIVMAWGEWVELYLYRSN